MLWLMVASATCVWIFKIERYEAGVEFAVKTLASLALPAIGVAVGRWGIWIGERQGRPTTIRIGRAAYWLFAALLLVGIIAVLIRTTKDAFSRRSATFQALGESGAQE